MGGNVETGKFPQSAILDPQSAKTEGSHLMRVYFYVRNDEGCLQEDVITLAEGLRELGISFHANCNYW